MDDLFQQGYEFFYLRQFLLVDQYKRVLKDYLLRVPVGDKIRGEVTFVKLHAFNHVHRGLDAASFLDGNHTVFPYTFHGVGDVRTYLLIAVGRHRCHLGNLFLAGNGDTHLVQFLCHLFNGLFYASTDGHRVCSGSFVLQALQEDGLRYDGSGGGAVTGDVIGLGGYFLYHFGTHVLVRVFQFYFLGYCDTVLCDGRGTEAFFNDYVSAPRSQCNFDGLGYLAYSTGDYARGIFPVENLLNCHGAPTSCAETQNGLSFVDVCA